MQARDPVTTNRVIALGEIRCSAVAVAEHTMALFLD